MGVRIVILEWMILRAQRTTQCNGQNINEFPEIRPQIDLEKKQVMIVQLRPVNWYLRRTYQRWDLLWVYAPKTSGLISCTDG